MSCRLFRCILTACARRVLMATGAAVCGASWVKAVRQVARRLSCSNLRAGSAEGSAGCVLIERGINTAGWSARCAASSAAIREVLFPLFHPYLPAYSWLRCSSFFLRTFLTPLRPAGHYFCAPPRACEPVKRLHHEVKCSWTDDSLTQSRLRQPAIPLSNSGQ